MAQPAGRRSDPGPPPAILKLVKLLKKKYGKGTVLVPGTKPELETTEPKTKKYEVSHVSLDDVYVKLHILEKSKLKDRAGHAAAQGTVTEMERMAHVFSCGGEEIKSLELGEILTLAARPQCRLPQKDGVRVLALAGAGLGKTTAFLKKGPMEWMRGNIWTDVELLFAFPLRQPEVHLAKDLEDLLSLKRHGVHRQGDREDILEYVNENLDCLCIILDGLDEVDISKCSTFIQNLIKGDDLDGAQLIVTSRPSIPVIELAKENPFNMRVEILGFNRDDVARFVSKILRPEDATKVLEQVEASPALASYMQIPVNAVHVCMLYRSGVTTIPTTMSSITSAIIRQVIDQNEKKKVKRVDVAESFADMNPVLLDPVMELQAFAFKMLVDKVLVFEKRHFDECQLSDNARSLGVLVACDYDSPDATPQFVFSHLSIHEGFAARHVASSITQNDISWMVWTLGSLTGHLNTFWRFLAAELNAEELDTLICALLTKTEPESDNLQQVVKSSSENPSAVATTASASIDVECMYVDRILQHLDGCCHIINPASLRGNVSPEFVRRFVKSPRHPAVPDTPKQVAIYQEAFKVIKTTPPVADVGKDISQIRHFFSASHSQLCRVADNLSEHLDIANAERLAERLLEGVVHGSGTLAVRSAMPGASELRGRNFLRAMLQFWKQRVPRANIQMLYRAIAEFDLLIAAKCFPSLDHSHLPVAGCDADKQLEHVNLQSEEGKQLLLLCCHCYQEYSSCHGNSPILVGFQRALQVSRNFSFSGIQLTDADCRALAAVLNRYHSAVSSINLSACQITDTGYDQLVGALSACTKLQRLYLWNNHVTDRHADHVAKVIRNNCQTLIEISTLSNSLTSSGNKAVHSNTSRCWRLKMISLGGARCVDTNINMATVTSILSSRAQIQYLTLYGCSLQGREATHLTTLLSSHKLVQLSLHAVGLTSEFSTAMSTILRQQQPQLVDLSLSHNYLTSNFLLEAAEALHNCTHLRYVYLIGTGLTASAIPLLTSLLGSWPDLQCLDVANNAFRDSVHEQCHDLATAVAAHSSLTRITFPHTTDTDSKLLAALADLVDSRLLVEFKNY